MKKKHTSRTLADIEASARLTSDELAKLSGQYIREELLAADRRAAGARSVAAAGGVCPPPTNRGGKSGQDAEYVDLVLDDGKIKQVPKRRGFGGDTAFIDWINFTIGDETLWEFFQKSSLFDHWEKCNFAKFNEELAKIRPVTPYECMLLMSDILVKIFGFGITAQRKQGANFYKTSWALGPLNDKTGAGEYGMVCYGGQRNTIMVGITGSGCAAAMAGWEIRLKEYLENSSRSRITRLDLAHDDFHGLTYTVDKADQDHTSGLFKCGGRNPDCEYRGNWKNHNGKGRTFNVGNRKNGKFCRVYEKGRQLGDENSEWTRIEVEFKSVDRIIPFDALLKPGEYLAAAYPAFVWISEKQERIFTTQKVCESNVEKAVKWIRHQCGPSIGVMVELFGVEKFLSKVVRDGEPSWVKVPNFLLSPAPIQPDKGSVLSLQLAAETVAF